MKILTHGWRRSLPTIPTLEKHNIDFDVGVGSFDSAEICELCGLYLLSLLVNLGLNLGLYRDDGLGVSHLTARQNEKVEEVFNDAIKPYQEALDKSGFQHKLKFDPPKKNKQTTRKRNITYFNPLSP